MKAYTKVELKALGLPASIIAKSFARGTKTVGFHKPSGARCFANLYYADGIVQDNVSDQATLDQFLARLAKAGFQLSTMEGLENEILKHAQWCALEYKGVKYEYPESLDLGFGGGKP